MNTIDLKTEEVQYLLSLVLTRYHQLKKTEEHDNDCEISDSIKRELSILISLYSKIEPLNRTLQDNKP